MTKSKSKTFIYFLLAVSLILCSMLALTACGEPYQMTYGTYNSYGIRTSNASGNTDLSLEEAREQGNIFSSTYEKIIFNCSDIFNYRRDNNVTRIKPAF